MRLLVLLSWTGLGPADELPPPPAADPAAPYPPPAPPGLTPSLAGGKGEVAARVDPTAPIQRMLTAMVMGPGLGSGMWWCVELLVA